MRARRHRGGPLSVGKFGNLVSIGVLSTIISACVTPGGAFGNVISTEACAPSSPPMVNRWSKASMGWPPGETFPICVPFLSEDMSRTVMFFASPFSAFQTSLGSRLP